MKTKIKVETIVQPMYKTYVKQNGITKTFCCNANSIEEAQNKANKMCPNHTIGYTFECIDNWILC